WEQELPIAGEGAPTVAEFCVPELAAVLGLSTDAGRAYLGHAVELRYRLPRVFARVVAGDLVAWRARRVAQRTTVLCPAAAGFVDAHVAPVAHKIGPVRLDRLIEEAQTRFDPEETERLRLEAAERRRFDIHATTRLLDGVGGITGVVEVSGVLDLADALDLDTTLQAAAADLGALGGTETLDVRRSMALGHLGRLARGQDTLDLAPSGTDSTTTAPATPATPAMRTMPAARMKDRRLVLHVHLADTAIARLEQTRAMITVAQVQSWCTEPATTVTIQPVIDLNTNPHTSAYEIPDRIRDHVILRDHTCVFPWCTRPARRADLDHRQNWPEGETDARNLAPLCRRHHRTKTHTTWTYDSPEPGVHEWRSPHGYHYRRDPTGTTDLT
ncbi:MAG: HNH endonuclease, partial [Nocardioides sp.]|nr:HNH endonuclease [Nocardioides sp.]